MNEIIRIWDSLPGTVRVLIWVGVSAALTAVGTELLNRPELFNYYGAINIVLYGLNELDKKVRRNKK